MSGNTDIGLYYTFGDLWVIKWMAVGNTALLMIWNKLGFSCTGQILHHSGKADQDKMIRRILTCVPWAPMWVKNIPESQQIFTLIIWPHLIAAAWLHWLQFLCHRIQNISKPSVHLAPSLRSYLSALTQNLSNTQQGCFVFSPISSHRPTVPTILAFFFHSFTAIFRTTQIFSSTMYFCILFLQRVCWSRTSISSIHLPTYLPIIYIIDTNKYKFSFLLNLVARIHSILIYIPFYTMYKSI